MMRLTKKTLIMMLCGCVAVILLLVITGCSTPNPGWGGSRW